MAAPLGFKTFNTGDVLTAADTNGYLMQGVWTFANSAARTAAVTSPQEGNVSFLKDTNSLEIYDGAAWVSYGGGDITGVTAGTGISGGGTSGDVTITNSMATAIDAKGDLIAGTGADAFSRLAVGTNNQVLTADSTTATGLKWSTVAAGGFTELASGSLSGSSVVLSTISSSYIDLKLILRNPYGNPNYGSMRLELNSNTGSNYSGWTTGGSTTWSTSTVDYAYNLGTGSYASFASIEFYFRDYANSSTRKGVQATIYAVNAAASSPTNYRIQQDHMVFNSNSAISTITMIPENSPWNGGTYVLYGVK